MSWTRVWLWPPGRAATEVAVERRDILLVSSIFLVALLAADWVWVALCRLPMRPGLFRGQGSWSRGGGSWESDNGSATWRHSIGASLSVCLCSCCARQHAQLLART